MCKKTIILLVLLTTAVAVACSAARAEERMVYDEIASTDGVHDIVLTVTACPLDPNHGYTKYAYIKQQAGGHIAAEGCWMDYDASMFDIWVPAMKAHFQMYKGEFRPYGKPRPMRPEEM